MQTRSFSFVFFFISLFIIDKAAGQTVDMVGPSGSGAYGTSVTVLPNGNYVVTDPYYSEGGVDSIGAVYLYNGSTNALISVLKGSSKNDWVGNGGITLLKNGNYVLSSLYWNNGMVAKVGAATWCSGSMGLNGVVNANNSLVGSTANDNVGTGGIAALTNGNYVVNSGYWNNGNISKAGASTWCNGNTGMVGIVSTTNSLIGSSLNDYIGLYGTYPLLSGNYLFRNPNWTNGSAANAGAVTWGNGAMGSVGLIDSNNSLVGTVTNEGYGVNIRLLPNGNYLIESQRWNNSFGAITWGNGSSGVTGIISSTNSWVGTSTFNDNIEYSTVLSNGNYLINGNINGQFGTTWANGSTGAIVTRTTSNSFLGGGVDVLGNGAYVVTNANWNGNRGAVAFCKADGSTVGTFNSANSLMGANANDYIGSAGIIALANNNYVVCSPNWNGKRGAATLCQSDGLTIGIVGSNNSLIGTNINDSVGCGSPGTSSTVGAIALTNGNYVVISPNWKNYIGAATWCNGTLGTIGQVGSSNSLIGSVAGDRLGIGGIYTSPYDGPFYISNIGALKNGNYFVATSIWNSNTGAVTFGNGKTGTFGTINNRNSFIGVSTISENGPSLAATLGVFMPDLTAYYNFGPSFYLQNLSDNYIIQGINGTSKQATITWGNGTGGTIGSPTSCSTVFGKTTNGINTMNYKFDSVYNYLLVSRPAENIVSRYYPALGAAIPNTNDNSSATISGNSPFVFPTTTGCGQIAALTPAGANPVSGSVTAKTWLESPQPTYFVARHYEITPTTNPTTSTGTITLYYTQGDFDGFNNQSPAPTALLPTSPNDATGKSHLLVEKQGGVSNVGTGLPGTYPGPITTINPDDTNIVWNTALNRWEVTFDVTGFSGFFIKTATAAIVLPLQLLNFSGIRQGNNNLLQWTTANEVGTKTFVIESSANGISFTTIGNVAATGSGKYSYIDINPLANRTYYRLKMIDIDGSFTYSAVQTITVVGDKGLISIYPTPVHDQLTVILSTEMQNAQLQLVNSLGQTMFVNATTNGSARLLNMGNLPAGLYLLKVMNGTNLVTTQKVVKQ